jgi:hypothetical protein
MLYKKFFWNSFFQRLFLFLPIVVAVCYVYYPSLFHLPRADHLFYLADMAGKNDWGTLALKSYDFTRSRTFAPGDDVLFRPVAIFLLGTEKAIFGYNFVGWQAVGIGLHLLVVWHFFKLLWQIRAGFFSFLFSLFFALLFFNFDLVTWHHINSIMLGLIMVLIALFQYYRYVIEDSKRIWRLVIMASCLTVSCFTYEIYNAYALVTFICLAFSRGARDERRGYYALLLLPVVLYVLVSFLHLASLSGLVVEKELILAPVSLVTLVKNTFLTLRWWLMSAFFPGYYHVVFFLGRAGLADPSQMLHIPDFQQREMILAALLVLIYAFIVVKTTSWRVIKEKGPFLALLFLILFCWVMTITLYRVNNRGVAFALAGSLYYSYMFWLFFLVFLYAVVDVQKLKALKNIYLYKFLAAILLGFVIVMNAVNLYKINLSLAEEQAPSRRLIASVESLIFQYKTTPGFSFYIDPNFPGNYPVPNRLRLKDPSFKRYSFIELLYLNYYDEDAPRFLFLANPPRVIQSSW